MNQLDETVLWTVSRRALSRRHHRVIKSLHRKMQIPPTVGFDAPVYEIYEDLQGCSSGQIKEDFHELYRLLNGVPLTELDRIINPVCTLCRDHEQSGFIHGVQVGVRLAQEIRE